jgi:hypothetical protein
MAGKKRKQVRERDITGLKYFDQLVPLLERLHQAGCQRDKAGNRQLHYDEYALLILLFIFNPVVTSLRGLQQASELKKVQRKLGCLRASLGSLSEATEVFDPDLLRGVVAELYQQAQPVLKDRRLDCLTQKLTAVDGTLLARLPQITQAAWQTRRHPNGWRLHTHFEVLRGLPSQVTLTDGRNRGQSNEKKVLRHHLQADCCYVTDRGYEQYSLFNAIVKEGSSYVCRIRNDHQLEDADTRMLSDDAQAEGVVSDQVGRLGSSNSKRIEHSDHPVRRVVIRAEPHEKRGGRHRHPASQEIVLATNLLDVPAEIIALLYRYRWTVEIFFRFFKHVLGCRHLLSHDPAGIEIQTYCAIIACLLISLWTGRKPTLRTHEMVCLYFQGWADEEELLAHIAKLKLHNG